MPGLTGVKSINVYHELDRLGVKWTSSGDDEIRLPCPAHEDSSPSASLNVAEHKWICYASHCGAHGDFVSYIAYALGQKRPVVLADLQTRYPDIKAISEIPAQTIEKFHGNLRKAGPMLEELRKRGINDDLMREARLGFHEGRITIPVYDGAGRCINVRRYLPGAPGPQKMRNTKGHGSPALYGANWLNSQDVVVVCGGEMKALAVHGRMPNVAAISTTGGEGHWKDEWTAVLKEKHVVICMDVDEAGSAASRRLAIAMHGKVASVKVVKLPLDQDAFPKGDVNDWFGQCGASGEDMSLLIDETDEWVPPTKELIPRGDAKKMDLNKAISNDAVGQLVEVEAVIAAADQTPFLVPREVAVECTRDQPGCDVCTVKLEKPDESGWANMTVDRGSAAVIGMVGASQKEQRERICQSLGIPVCKVVKFHVKTHHVVRDVRLSPPIDLSGGRINDAWYPAVVVSDITPDLNVPCRMRGAVYPSPKTQQAVALISELEEIEDSLSTFSCTDTELEALKIFQPRGRSLEHLDERISKICEDLESNVTWIYRRPELHIALDIAWHSVLMFKFGGRDVNGWINALVIGDSAQGKSEATMRMMQYYRLGDKVDCKNATVAGLMGGLEQMGGRWFVRWGAIPTRDRMLVVLEELKGASTEVLSKLTEMRSSGIAEIPKIERRRAMARTRLVMISNPRSPRPMSSFHYGVEAISELVGSLEDVRRYDYALALGRDEVPDDVINMPPSRRPKVQNTYTSALCRKLILWAWTRKPDDVIISPEAEDAIIDKAKWLTSKFSEVIPLVDKGTARYKLAKAACAIAARTFSTDDGVELDVQPRHVEYAAQFFDTIYSSQIMGYAEYSDAQDLMSRVQDPDIVLKAIRTTKYPKDLASVLLRRDSISIDDIISAAAIDYDAARTLLSTFVRKGALLRVGRSEYYKNPDFIVILKELRRAPDTNQHDVEGDEF